jgi:hypothetical protein
MLENKISINTPEGKLTAYLSTDPEHPGIYIDLDDEAVALVECIADKSDYRYGGIRTFAWEQHTEDFVTETPWN